MKIIVIGGGIFGASIACRLAMAGTDVTVVEAGPEPASGVTGLAFGWVNLIHSDPQHKASYALRQAAFAEWQDVPQEFPDAVRSARRGSLLWKSSAQATEHLVSNQSAAGTYVRLVERTEIARLEPDLHEAPDVAAYLPDDFALSPREVVRFFLAKAEADGARLRYNSPVSDILVEAGRAVGVRIGSEQLAADIMVVAGGAGSANLLLRHVPSLGLRTSPTILMRFAAEHQAIRQIVCGPDLEVRQTLDGEVFSAEGYIDDTPLNGPQAIARQVHANIIRQFPGLGQIHLRSVDVGYRPMLDDGMPRVGFVPGVEKLYVAVGHPGVILAPLVARLAAREIMAGERSSLLSAASLTP
ncbi:NAD(P)/FAD-dependent oxidoreductase [Rhizobium oryzicola]|uniref:FAD-dependent oxidoreductase n=1 Tax=Rhizobium oryzicola TaxID=1232668 RepID=A0ABT8T1D6_9HYPH|nr:FAD-dependent oxidoreductase [Rhizobium oryzicola]MDO1584574.1 FAD-dependent oxidoreductase [Rhizobium oryzicola]